MTAPSAGDAVAQVLFALPGYLIVVACCWSLAVIGYNLYVFPECPEASESLVRDLARARKGLQARGLHIDGD